MIHLHLVRPAPRAKPVELRPRPAKVVQLETRRIRRLETARPPRRPAA
jgi:hypothetical protein